MSEQLATLHRRAHRRHHGNVTALKADWRAYSAYADALAARLPFRWHPVACDNPTQNHSGYTNGQDHIVLDEPFDSGRLHRRAGDALCRPHHAGGNLWGESDGPTCKRCLEIAERITEQVEAITPADFHCDPDYLDPDLLERLVGHRPR